MAARRRSSEASKTRRKPATTPEGRENEMVSAAIDLAEKQIRQGTASSQVITHFLKLGSTRERLEQQRLEHENELTRVKIEALESQKRVEELYMNGTADEKAMLNYWNRTIEPVLTAMVEAMRRRFLTKTARTQKQSILFFRDPFRLVPVENIAEIADKFTRNEIMTSNEMRQVVGLAPHPDPNADKLLNSNMPQAHLPIDGTVSETNGTVSKTRLDLASVVDPRLGKDVQNGSRRG